MRRPPSCVADRGDPAAFDDRRAAVARALRERLRQVGRIRLAVARQPHAADQVAGRHDRIALARLGRRDRLHRRRRMRGRPRRCASVGHPLGRPRDGQRSRISSSRSRALSRPRARRRAGAVADQPRHRLLRAKLADQPGRVPRRAARQRCPCSSSTTSRPAGRQVIGDPAADDAAADDDDPRRLRWPHLRRQCLVRHRLPRSACLYNGVGRPAAPKPAPQVILERPRGGRAVSDARATRRVAYIAHALRRCHAFGRVKVSMP